jgi:hypothetical protein
MENLKKLDNTIEQLERQSRDLEEFARIYKLISSLKSDIELSQVKIVENNDSFSELVDKIQNVLGEYSESLESMENKLLEKVRELYDDNKKYQKDLDGTINSKLEKNKSDIEVTVRNEGAQIQRAFETSLKSNFTEMSGAIDDRFALQSKTVMRNTTLLIVILLVQLVTGLLVYLN